MTISFLSSSENTGTPSGYNPTPISVPKPSGVQPGDLLLAWVASNQVGQVRSLDGFTELRQDDAGIAVDSSIFYRVVDGTEGATLHGELTTEYGGYWCINMSAWRGVDNVTPIDTSAANTSSIAFGDSPDAPSVTTTVPGAVVVGIVPRESNIPSMGTSDLTLVRNAGSTDQCVLTAWEQAPTPGATGDFSGFSVVTNQTAYGVTQTVALVEGNTPPNAPVLNAPADGGVIAAGVANRFTWTPDDPDPDDSQSAYNLRHRQVGTSTWTETGWVSSVASYHDFAAGTFTAGVSYEWQVATKDALGEEGPYSSSSFFSADTTPTGATILSPANGGTWDQTVLVEWSVPNQDAYQLQVLDAADAVTQDTGTVTTIIRAHEVTFPTNNVSRTIRVRVQYNTLWSDWTEITGTVTWTPPPTPSYVIDYHPSEPTFDVVITNPASGAGEPATLSNDVYITDPGETEERRARGVAVNGTWRYYTPPSNFDGVSVGAVRVVAHGDNGATASS